MSRIRWYLDEDTQAQALIQALRARGADVMTVAEAGLGGAPDEAQLERANAEKRVLYTFNVGDFARLDREWTGSGRVHAGIVVVSRQRYGIGEQLRGLLAIGNRWSAEQMRSRLEFLRL